MIISGNAPQLYPAETFFAVLGFPNGESLSVPYKYPLKGEWGDILSFEFTEPISFSIPISIDAVYLSIVEGKFYSIQKGISSLDDKDPKAMDGYNILVGFAPYGCIVIWLWSSMKSVLLSVLQGEQIDVSIEDFSPNSKEKDISEICKKYIKRYQDVEFNLNKNGLPHSNLFNNYMKQFAHRYLVIFEEWNAQNKLWVEYEKENIQPKFDTIEEMLFDGTFDKLNDGRLLKYHQAGKPKKLALKWHICKSEYSAYFWFEEESIREVFDKFYGAHPDTKTDFIIRIDAENKKYELALYRYGLKEPQVIPENVYQLLVFKNKFEDYRSDNYNQERGAWIW